MVRVIYYNKLLNTSHHKETKDLIPTNQGILAWIKAHGSTQNQSQLLFMDDSKPSIQFEKPFLYLRKNNIHACSCV